MQGLTEFANAKGLEVKGKHVYRQQADQKGNLHQELHDDRKMMRLALYLDGLLLFTGL